MNNLFVLISSLTILSLSLALALAETKGGVAVLVLDIQGDFTTAHKGSLAVPNTDMPYLEKVSRATEQLKQAGLPIFASQDWHPANHMSFASNHEGKKPFETIKLNDGRTQVLWPVHCVQGTTAAEILVKPDIITKVIQKGADAKFDSYSGFMDDGGAGTELDKALKASSVKTLIVYGIATDYCVKATALDGLKQGYNVYVVDDLCRGVADNTSKAALEEMKEKGAKIWPSLDLEKIRNL
ncbi:MAG: bifunctional nicotinamidase/pyrazinamidase [Desulfomonilaceae bacterium]|jgi:nicotinamidase/pyrazinamidase